jgi:(4S)-4-hydroxy-5-phosphonooxypentane-2,3-dione isomerase
MLVRVGENWHPDFTDCRFADASSHRLARRAGGRPARATETSRPLGENAMRKFALTSVAAVALLAGGSIFATMHGRGQSDADLDALLGMSAAAQAGGVYVNAVDLVVIPAEMPKFVEAIKENAAASVKEPGCREFNVLTIANRPNHVFLFEVYDNAAALDAHRNTDHFKKFISSTTNMIADRNVRALSVIAMNAKAHG